MYRVVLLLALCCSPLYSAASVSAQCLCGTSDVEAAINAADAVVLGQPETSSILAFVGIGPVEFQVDSYLKGSGPANITVSYDKCSAQWAGSRVQVLYFSEFGASTVQCYGPFNEIEVKEITGPGQPPDDTSQEETTSEGDHKDVPWVPILILAILIPLAALLVPAFILRSHDSSRDGGE